MMSTPATLNTPHDQVGDAIDTPEQIADGPLACVRQSGIGNIPREQADSGRRRSDEHEVAQHSAHPRVETGCNGARQQRGLLAYRRHTNQERLRRNQNNSLECPPHRRRVFHESDAERSPAPGRHTARSGSCGIGARHNPHAPGLPDG